MVRTGIATSETIGEVLENAGTPLSYGATAESWRTALTSISGEDTTIAPRQTEEVTGWMSTNETVLKNFNKDAGVFTVDITFVKDGDSIEVDSVTLNGIDGVKEDDHYEFASITSALKDVDLVYTIDGETTTVKKTYETFTDDVIIVA